MDGGKSRSRSLGLAVLLSIVVLVGLLLVSLADFFPLTFRSSATMPVGLSKEQHDDLIADFCATLARDANQPTSRVALTHVVADAALDYADHHRGQFDLRTAHAMLHAALAAERQDSTIAAMCGAAGHRVVSLNPEVHRPVSAATAAAAMPLTRPSGPG